MENLKRKNVLLDEPLAQAKKIGSGASGIAYRVKVQGAFCIGKRIHDILTGTGGCESVPKEQWRPFLDKFEQECTTLSELRHPNVVQFIGFHRPTSDPRDLVLVMEMLFIDVDKFVEKYHDVPLPIKLHVLKDVACGLLYLHAHQIVHRDLTAGNVLLTEDLRAKLADFGVSRVLEQQLLKSRPLTVMPGTPDYMPPEAETEYSFKLDCFSFGHLALYLTIEKYPKPQRLTRHKVRQCDLSLEIQQRLFWINQIGNGHCLYQTIVDCLQDEPDERPSMANIHKKIADLSQAQPKTLAMVADVLEKGKSVVMQKLQQLEHLQEQAEQHLALIKKQATEIKNMEQKVALLSTSAEAVQKSDKKITQLLAQIAFLKEEMRKKEMQGTSPGVLPMHIHQLEQQQQSSLEARTMKLEQREMWSNYARWNDYELLKKIEKLEKSVLVPRHPGDSWHKAAHIQRSELAKRYGNTRWFGESSGYIAAIDFGTSSCSLAYTTPGNKISTMKLNKYYARVPSAILLKEKEEPLVMTSPVAKTSRYKVVCFGYEAQEQHSKIRTRERAKYLYFERFKMTLQHDETVNRNMTVKAANGGRYYMVEVIAFIFSYLKQELVKHLSRTINPLEAKKFEWVITVPAIWRARGKRMMREAAYMAGLCSGEDGIDCFTIVGRGVPRPAETNPDRLILALEPEAAAIYCLRRKENEIASHCRFTGAVKSDHYLVVDIGGGTVDITAHKHDGKVGGIRVIVTPKGKNCGGTQVNQEYSKLLQKLFNDEAVEPSDQTTAFHKFFQCEDQASRHAIISNLVFGEFECQKLIFGNSASGFGDEDPATDENEITVALPKKVIEVYGLQNIEAGIAAIQDDRIQLEKGILIIKYSKLRELFQPAVDGILECIAFALEEMKTEVDTVYLVGGFGGCKYIYEKVYSLIQASCFPLGFRVMVPQCHNLAVVQGAVEYRRNPGVIRSRKMDASYGIDFAPPFNPAVHDIAYARRDSYGDIRVQNAFLKYVEKGEVIFADEVVTSEFYLLNSKVTSVLVGIYSSFSADVKYIKKSDDTPLPNVRKIGEFIIEMPKDANSTHDKQLIEVTMDFGNTDIQVRARCYVPGYEYIEIKTILDALSSV